MKIAAIIVAAGRGLRVGGDTPKQWRLLNGRPVLDRTLNQFLTHPSVGPIIVVVHDDDMDRAGTLAVHPDVSLVTGGDNRAASVLGGLEAVAAMDISHVLIHDAARPLVEHGLISRVCAGLKSSDGAAPALAVSDALWQSDGDQVAQTVDRSGLFRAQTPQGFELTKILAAHRNNTQPAADDVEIARAAGIPVTIVAGSEKNLKITLKEDFARAQKLMGTDMDIRVGNGFDVHRFGAGDHVVICGVKIAHDRALQGHSDADVGMHALTDAIYGALADGDIGQHFPPSDLKWRGADSAVFLAHAVSRAADQGYSVSNADVTLVCEEPKIGPYAKQMAKTLATIMKIDAGRVSVKATTSERLGFTGRGEGIAATATATLVKT